MELHERIALARKQAGLSQEQLGEKLGVSRQAVSKWESGQTNPDVAYLSQMCRLFDVSADWLLLGEESSSESVPARCPSCQTVVTGLDKFCPNCGRNLKGKSGTTYTLILREMPDAYSADIKRDLINLSAANIFPADTPLETEITPEQAMLLLNSAPRILASGLDRSAVERVAKKISSPRYFSVYPDNDYNTAEMFLQEEPLSIHSFGTQEREPLSFGMIVLAVVVAIVICSFL